MNRLKLSRLVSRTSPLVEVLGHAHVHDNVLFPTIVVLNSYETLIFSNPSTPLFFELVSIYSILSDFISLIR